MTPEARRVIYILACVFCVCLVASILLSLKG
jgi:hypothetical protein